MGVSRLLAKAWIATCLFAGAHSLRAALLSSGDSWPAVSHVLVAVGLFAAMGLLFVGGYGVSRFSFQHRAAALIKGEAPARPRLIFNDLVFLLFCALSFANQVWYAPAHLSGPITEAIERAMYFAVPGHAVVTDMLGECALDGGRVLTSATAWLLGLVFAASAISRLKSTAEAMRADRAAHPQSLSPTGYAAVLGIISVVAIQCVFVGSPLELLPNSLFVGLPGALLIGFVPLAFCYLIYATLAALLASGSEK